jgi:hypothetical protein
MHLETETEQPSSAKPEMKPFKPRKTYKYATNKLAILRITRTLHSKWLNRLPFNDDGFNLYKIAIPEIPTMSGATNVSRGWPSAGPRDYH